MGEKEKRKKKGKGEGMQFKVYTSFQFHGHFRKQV